MRKLIIILCVCLSSATSIADEVYNFYFQKAPGPTTVNQSGTTAPAKKELSPLTETVQPRVLTQAPLVPAQTLQDFYSWQVYAGTRLFQTGDHSESGFLGGKYRLSNYVGFDAGYAHYRSIYTYSGKATQANLALGFTPVHIDVFGYDLFEISMFYGGAYTTDTGSYDDNNNEWSPYIAVEMGIHLTKHLTLNTRTYSTQGNGGGYFTALAYQF